MQIQVTQEDIDSGNRGSTFNCPVARTVNRRIKGFCIVSGSFIRLIHWCAWATKLQYPIEVYRFIKSFDNYEYVRPFSFDLPIPEEWLND